MGGQKCLGNHQGIKKTSHISQGCLDRKMYDTQVLTSRQGWKAELLWVYSHEGKGLLLKQPTDN